ncbi:MAG: 4Fe-4S binding protein [Clostridia bacterium]|nr:4Fe-4S binding protein [Clostridia bacterium]
MPKVTINEERCRGCELCTTACPKNIIALSKTKLNAAGYHPAEITDQSICIACAMCARMCPHVAITVEK